MRQLLYISSRSPQVPVAIDAILIQSQRNNLAAGVTGLLYTDGHRFLQVLEGAEGSVAATFDRIKDDPRHRAIVMLSDRPIATREFGMWSMVHPQDTSTSATFDERIDRLLAGASRSVRGTFQGLIAARRAA